MKNKKTITSDDVVYIAGKMTGVENFNYDAFYDAEKVLRYDFGCVFLNPARTPQGLTYRDYMRIGTQQVCTSTAIYMLKGWEESKGAKAEYALAEALGLKIFFQE